VIKDRSIHELNKEGIHQVVDYFLDGSYDFLWNMGVDPKRMPPRAEWIKKISEDMDKPKDQREFYYVIWEVEGMPIGHSNINHIKFKHEASMHLHIWYKDSRNSGNGTYFVKKSIKKYFREFQLQRLYCSPNAHNPAPNKTLAKIGFIFLEKYEEIPGFINYKQPLNKWVIGRDQLTFDSAHDL